MFLTKDNKIKYKWLVVSTVIILALVFLGIYWFDKPLYLFIRSLNTNTVDTICYTMGKIFSFKIWLAVSGISMIIFYIKKAIQSTPKIRNSRGFVNLWVVLDDFLQKTKNNYAFFIFWSVFSACAVAGVLKVLLGRMRPLFFELFGHTGFYPMHTEWAFNSMPSGHTTASFAGLVMLGLLVPKFKPVTWTLGIIIALSRVYVGAHWPTDVILGAFIGMVAADVVKSVIKSRLGE